LKLESEPHMKRLLPLLFALLLSGCSWLQEQQVRACGEEAGRNTRRADWPEYFPADYVEACMHAHGYELNLDQCPALRDDPNEIGPAGMAALSEQLRKAYTEAMEKRRPALAAWRKLVPACYEPRGWFGKQVLRIEKWLGIRN
jgi:hypothetical protein